MPFNLSYTEILERIERIDPVKYSKSHLQHRWGTLEGTRALAVLSPAGW